MIRTFAALVLTAALLASCGDDSSSDDGARKSKDSVAEVGKDLKAGVYTAKVSSCTGFTATTREFNIMDEKPNGEMLGGSVLVRDRNRIVLNVGDFFHTMSCTPGAWKREKAGSKKSIDPTTVEGACTLLIADGLLEDALEYPKDNESEKDGIRRGEIQERLMSIVTASAFAGSDDEVEMPLVSPAGQIVDFLDDPGEYMEDGKLSPTVATEVAKIEKTCA